ncbi:MAG: metalloregulator ArsR/SmtB family transcription factor [Sandaracinus sp.]
MNASLEGLSDLFAVLGDPTRLRIACVLGKHELSVAELTELLGVAQSRVSTQLSRLRTAGVLKDRKAGTSTFSSVDEDALSAEARDALAIARRSIDPKALDGDLARAAALVKRREGGDKTWPEAVAGRMEKHYSPGRTWESMALAFLQLAEVGDVLDAGCGDGTVASMIAPIAASLTCLDKSERLVEAARARLEKKARVLVGDVEALPLPEASFDTVLLLHVLASVRDPERALAECARVLRPGGRVLVVTLDKHEHLDVAAQYGHVHAGFRPKQVQKMLEKVGLSCARVDVTSRERREPFFSVVTAVGRR